MWRSALPVVVLAALATPARAQEHHTPLAGEPFKTEVLGYDVHLDRRDRGQTLAINLGGYAFAPPIGSDSVLPVFALYWKHTDDDWRIRAVLSGIDDEVDEALELGKHVELLGHFDNSTSPFAQTEIVNGESVDSSSLVWGTLSAWFGGGLTFSVAPGEVDNVVRLQAYAHFGYFYDHGVHDTSPQAQLPPDTLLYGGRVRFRYDGMRRNLLELLHEGLAFGADVELTRRDTWHDYTLGHIFRASDTRDVLKISAYAVAAFGIPFLWERHRVLAYVHGGYAAWGQLDRFSAFRVGGGPFPYESDDLYRPPYPGAVFYQIPARGYFTATVEYRFEITFFLFASIRGTAGYVEIPSLTTGIIRTRRGYGEAFSAGINSGFAFNSQIAVDYSWDPDLLRAGKGGHSVLLLWSKGF